MRDNVIFLIGRSGSGKSTIADMLVERNGWSSVVSYTTRARRYRGEQGHIFVDTPTAESMLFKDKERVSSKDLKWHGKLKNNIIAYTFFNGNHYWATREQIKGTTVYVIDQAGVDYFQEHFPHIRSKSFYLDLPAMTCFHRMVLRDGETKASERYLHDLNAFRTIKADYTIVPYDNNERTCELIEDLINYGD